MIDRALSIRIIFMACMIAAATGALVGLVWPAAVATVVWVVGPVAYVALAWDGGDGRGQMVKCPRCMARVKIGADTCRRCGWTQ